MLIFIRNKHLKELRNFMSQWKTDIDTLIAKIATGNATDQATKDAVAELQAKLTSNDTGDTALKGRVTELEAADAEFQTVITDIVTKLQAGDTAGALAAATEAQA